MNPRAARGLALGLIFLSLPAITATAQTSPGSIGVLVDQVVSLFPKVDGDVLEVQDTTVTLSLGKKDGLAPGVELSVYRQGRELRHPRTGVFLGKTEETVGRVLVEQVFEAYATGRVTQGTDVKPGDRARVSAGRVPLTVVPLVEGVKDALATGLVQEGLTRKDILEGKGLAKAAAAQRPKVENALVVLVKSVEKKPFMDVRLFSFPGPSQMLTTGLFVPPSVKPAPSLAPSRCTHAASPSAPAA